MADFAVFYFSGTGNSWWAAHGLCRMLQENGKTVRCRSIEAGDALAAARHTAGYGHLVLVFPVYGSAPPAPMRIFLAGLPTGGHRPVSILATQALASGDTAYRTALALRPKGWRVAFTRHLRMPNNLPNQPFFQVRNGRDIQPRLQTAGAELQEFAKALCKGGFAPAGRGVWAGALGGLQRLFERPMQKYFNGGLRIEKAQCTACGLCAALCPAGNIRMAEGGPYFMGHCALCLRCYCHCPHGVVQLGKTGQKGPRQARYKGPPGYCAKTILLMKKTGEQPCTK